MTTDGELSEIAELLDDPYARDILAETSIEPMSAKMLSERCDASLPTIYRRIEHLQEHDLLTSQQQLAPDGNHYKMYVARLDRVAIDLTNGTYNVEITRTKHEAADRFSDLVEELK